MVPETGMAGLSVPAIVATAIGSFLGVALSFNKWLDMRKTDKTHVTILQESIAYHEKRAEAAESKAEKAWAKVDELSEQVSELKSSNATLLERVSSLTDANSTLLRRVSDLTEANDRLSKSLEEFMRGSR